MHSDDSDNLSRTTIAVDPVEEAIGETGPECDLLAILGSPPDPTRGLYVMDPGVVRAEVGDRVEPSEDEPTSSEEAVRIRRLRSLARDPDDLYRRHVVADDAMIARLDALRAMIPNGGEAIDIVVGAARLSARTGAPVAVPPIILLGPPGCGKSRLIRELASALKLTTLSLLASTMADASPLLGTAIGWKGAGPGRLADALLKSRCSSILVFIDEIDKMKIWDRSSNPCDILLGLLDRDMASKHEDRYYQIPMRAEQLIWMFAANSIDNFSAPFLDRCIVVEMSPPAFDARRAIIERIYAEVCIQLKLDPTARLDASSVDRLASISLRHIAPTLTLALGRAATTGRETPGSDDLAWACDLMERGREPRGRAMGFVSHDA